MARAARSISGELRGKVDAAAEAGGWSLVVVAMLAVGREGLETALFLWAATRVATRDATGGSRRPGSRCSAPRSASSPRSCWATCSTAARSRSTSASSSPGPARFLILVAAGVLSYGVHDLQEAGVLPGLNNLAFDVSDTIDAEHLVRHGAQGHLQLQPGHDLARGRRLGRCTSSP